MTDTLRTLRTELVETITGITTYDHVPSRAALPCAFIAPGSPYIKGGDTFGPREVRFALVLLTHPTLNQIETEQLDSSIETALHALEAADWTVEEVEQPIVSTLGSAEVFSTTMRIVCEAQFTRKEKR